MSNLENFKWTVSRIDMFHDVFSEQISGMELRFERYSDTFNSWLKESRNYILSGVGICLTILFGYNTIYPLEQWLFHLVLGVLFAIGFTIFILINWIAGQVENLFSDLSTVARIQHSTLLESKNHIIMSVIKLENTDYKYVENYLVFVMLLTAAIMLQFSKDFQRLSKKYSYIPKFKQSLQKESKTYKDSINENQIIMSFDLLDRSQSLPLPLLEFIEKTLKKYIKKDI